MVLFTYTEGNGKTLAQVASEFDLEESDLEPYNRWVRKNRIPDDKQYYVIIPDYSGRVSQPLLAEKPEPSRTNRRPQIISQPTERQEQEKKYVEVDDTDRFPVVRQATRWGNKVTLINDIPGVIAQSGDDILTISQRAGVAPSKLVKFNDLTSRQSTVSAGMPYYLKRKRNKGATHYHTVEPGETLWSISQRFGIKLKKLMRNNRIEKEQDLRAGRVLWLRFIRPPHIPIEYRDVPAQEAPPLSRREEKPRPAVSEPGSVRTAQTIYHQSSENEPPPAEKQERTVKQSESAVKKEAAKGEQSTANPPSRQEISQTKPEPTEEKELVPVLSEPKSGNDRKDYHTVQAGETLYSIARNYDMTIPQLTSYNNIDWEVPLAVGQRLRLTPAEESVSLTESSEPSSPEGRFFMHRVVSGETLYGIARQYNVTIKDLMDWNDKEDFDVSVGEELKVRKK